MENLKINDAISNKQRLLRFIPIALILVYGFIMIASIIMSAFFQKFIGTTVILVFGIMIIGTLNIMILIDIENYESPISLKAHIVITSALTSTILIAIGIYNGIKLNNDFGHILKAILTVFMKMIPILLKLGISALVVFIIGVATYQAIKWVSWNGYSGTFIAITRNGNIKRFNSIESIPEKLPESASIEDMVLIFQKYHTTIQKHRENHKFW